jgi:Predicted rRNA methylase
LGVTAADIGASNGGFTDCLLRAGAKRVYAVDVAECALPEHLKNDSRVIVKDKLNAREISVKDLGEKVDFLTVDVSFISLKLILPAVLSLLKEGGRAILLIKPQFELGRRAGKNGIVTDAKARYQTVKSVLEYIKALGFSISAICAVPKTFKNKNVEYTVLLSADRSGDISNISFSDFKNIF